jgi:hypothetical protein
MKALTLVRNTLDEELSSIGLVEELATLNNDRIEVSID